MRRWIWLAPVVLAATAAHLGAQGGAPVAFDPTNTLQRRTQMASLQFEGELAVAEQKAQLGMELAAEERRLNVRNAARERATTIVVASEVYRQSARDPQARQMYIQAVGQANQQYQQAIGQAYQTWAQVTNQTLQTCLQEGQTALQVSNTELSTAWQSFAQTMPNFDKEPGEASLEELQPADSQPGGEQAKALAAALKAARDKYGAALKEADASWQQLTQQAIQGLRAKQMAEELATGQLRKANRMWLTTMTDALEELRASSRAALRKYQFAALPE